MNMQLSVFLILIALSAAYIPRRRQSWPVRRGGVGINKGYGVSPMAYGFSAMDNRNIARGYGARSYAAWGYGERSYGVRGYGFDRGMDWGGSYNSYYNNNNYRSRYNSNRYRMRYTSDSDYYNRDYDNYFFDEDNYDDDDDYNRYMAFYGRYGQSFYGNYRSGSWARKGPVLKSVAKQKRPFVMQKKAAPKWQQRFQSRKWRPRINLLKWRPQIKSSKWRPLIKSPKWRRYNYIK